LPYPRVSLAPFHLVSGPITKSNKPHSNYLLSGAVLLIPIIATSGFLNSLSVASETSLCLI